MRNIFIGFLFVFLDFNINLDATQIGLIPDFIGYILLTSGLQELSRQSERFAKARPHAVGMAVYTGVLYLAALLGVWISAGQVFELLLGLISMLVSFYISYQIAIGISDMEKTQARFLNAAGVYSTWKLFIIFSAASYILLFIPPLAILSFIATFIITIFFLVAIGKSKNLYYSNGAI